MNPFFLSSSERLADWKELRENISSSKETNFRYMGIRSINSLLLELKINYKIVSGVMSIKNKNTTYWVVLNGDMEND